MDVPAHNILHGEFESSICVSGISEDKVIGLLSRRDRPTAVFCGDMRDAEKVYICALKLGLKVPEKLSIISCCDREINSYIWAKIGRITKREYDVGAKAASLLGEMKAGITPIDSSDVFYVDLEFEPAETTGAAPR